METDFYAWINDKIDGSGYTKRALAEEAGISASLVYAITTEERKPSLLFCVAVAPILKVPTLELLKRAGFLAYPAAQNLSADLADVVRILSDLDAGERAVVVRMVRGLNGHDPRS